MYLRKENTEPAANLLNTPLWSDIKKCLLERRPEFPDSADAINIAAAKGFCRKGFELAIEEIEKLPFDRPVERIDPFNRPSVLETID